MSEAVDRFWEEHVEPVRDRLLMDSLVELAGIIPGDHDINLEYIKKQIKRDVRVSTLRGVTYLL